MGLCLLLVAWPEEQKEENSNVTTLSKTDPSLYPFYATLVGGPLICLTGALHASLQGAASSVIGAISAILSTAYFVCTGHVAYVSGQTILETMTDIYSTELVSPSLLLMLLGVVGEALSWLSVMILTVDCKYKCESKESDNKQNLNSKDERLHCPYLPGLARKMSVQFIAISTTGWLILASRINPNDCEEFYEIGIFYVGPFLFLTALLHAGCSESIGVLVSILSMLYVMFMGAGLISYGKGIHFNLHDRHNKTRSEYCTMLAGSIISLVFWTCVLALWPFYHSKPRPQRVLHCTHSESKVLGKAVLYIYYTKATRLGYWLTDHPPPQGHDHP